MGAGGAAEGYRRAGYAVTGVDFLKRRDRPPGVEFIKADVRDVLTDLAFLRSFDLVHASPPCKVHTRLGHLVEARGDTPLHGDMVDETRTALDLAGVPYVIENVEGSPLVPHVVLCGSHFDLHVYRDGQKRWLKRHRLFELGGWGLLGVGLQPECWHDPRSRPLGVYGRTKGDELPGGGEVARDTEEARELMGMPWASWGGITQAIPPAYTEYLGRAAAVELFLADA